MDAGGSEAGSWRSSSRHVSRICRSEAAGARAAVAGACGRKLARGDRRGHRREGEEREGDAVPRPQAPRRDADEERTGPGGDAMTTECPFEPNVLDAIANDELTEAIR